MGYRPDSQALEGPIHKILEGIKPGMEDFMRAIEARVESGQWTAEHIHELVDVSQDLTRLRVKLQELASNTW